MSLCNDGSNAPSYTGNMSPLHVSPMPLGMKAAHDPTVNDRCAVGEAKVPRGSEDIE